MAQINKPNEYFNTKLYTGTGAEHNITGVGFQPDWTWIKERNNVTSHRVFDVIRGATVEMFPDLSDGESTDAQSLKSFDSDGFTLGTDGATNGSSDTYASWNWLAGGTASSNTDGSITSNVSANTTSGFSIVSYTGTDSTNTIGHGLGSTPKMIFVKDRDAGNDWFVYHGANTSAPETDYLKLNSSSATADLDSLWNDTAPTSSVFTIGTNGNINTTGNKYISYCFAEKKGFSKFGSYIGNANANGPFIYTGFKPAFLVIKQTNSARNWIMMDAKRSPFNIVTKYLKGNGSSAEETYNYVDFLSNGFKCRDSDTGANASGGTYIYYAFAENPLVGTNNTPATAR